jgi:polyhydroxybutyrate depolymerase
MAYRLGLEAPGLVAGIAAMAASLPVDSNLDCEPSGVAVAAMVMNGTADPVNPYEGGLVDILGDTSRGTVTSSAETAGYWAGLAGHSGAGVQREWPRLVADDETAVVSTEWSAQGRVPVSLVTIVGGGHTVPNPVFNLPRIIGPTSHQLDGPEVIWAFFKGLHTGVRDGKN